LNKKAPSERERESTRKEKRKKGARSTSIARLSLFRFFFSHLLLLNLFSLSLPLKSSDPGPHPHFRKHRSGVPSDELLLASAAADGHGGVAHLSPEEEEEAFEREWGLTLDAEARLLSEFKESILSSLPPGKTLPPHTDDYKLRRFLRARQHDLGRARDMWDKHVRWREEFGVDSELPSFHFHERDAFVSLYPQGYHRVDRLGRPVYIQHVGSIDMRRLLEVTTEDREYEFFYVFFQCFFLPNSGLKKKKKLTFLSLSPLSLCSSPFPQIHTQECSSSTSRSTSAAPTISSPPAPWRPAGTSTRLLASSTSRASACAT